jgi:parallel beta-helix repeat protein
MQVYNGGGPGSWAFNVFNQNEPFPNRNIVRNNFVYNTEGILLWRGDSNIAYNNVVYGGRYGFSIGGGATNTKVYNNTIYNNSVLGIDTVNSTSTMVRNNIVYQNGTVPINATGTNLTVSTNLTTDPKFANASGGDFHLQAGSPAIATGADLSAEGISTDITGLVSRPPFNIGAY